MTERWIEKFNNEGWAGPFRLLDQSKLTELTECYWRNKHKFAYRDYRNEYHDNKNFIWFKSMHVYLAEFREILSQRQFKERICRIIGNDALVWGMTVTSREPGQIHRWHGDIEHFKWNGITAFIGLLNSSKDSSLKIITRSHKFNILPQLYGNISDESLYKIACEMDNKCKLLTIPISDGEFFLFHGKLWHASENKSKDRRLAIVVQVAYSNQDLFIPLNYDEPVDWCPISPPTFPL